MASTLQRTDDDHQALTAFPPSLGNSTGARMVRGPITPARSSQGVTVTPGTTNSGTYFDFAAQGVAANPFAGLTPQQRGTVADLQRDAWQAQARGGLRNGNQEAMDLYNAEQMTRGGGITAQRGANGVMEFSGSGANADPSMAQHQGYTQGVDFGLSRDASGNIVGSAPSREELTAMRDELNFNRGAGGSFRKRGAEEMEREMLNSRSRSTRNAGVQLSLGRQQARQQAQQLALDRGAQMARLGLDTQRFNIDQAEHGVRMTDAEFIRQARQGLVDTANSTDAAKANRARMAAIAAGLIKPETPAKNEYAAVTDSMGLNVTRTNKDTGAIDIINPKTGEVRSIPAPDAITVPNRVGMQAPASALAFLRANPQHAAAFKAKYGYLPEGY